MKQNKLVKECRYCKSKMIETIDLKIGKRLFVCSNCHKILKKVPILK